MTDANGRNSTSNSKHRRITVDLRNRILAGQWPAGAMLPGRRELAREFNVSAPTLERAIVPLIIDGTLRADSRRGTFVAPLDSAAEIVTEPSIDTDTPVSANSRPGQTSVASGSIGIVTNLYPDTIQPPRLHNYFMRQILDSIERCLAENRQSTTFFNRMQNGVEESIPLGELLVEVASKPQLSGIIVICFEMEPDAVAELVCSVEPRIPIVSVLPGESTRPIPHVSYDNVGGGYLAADHLIRLGYTKLSLLMPFRAGWADNRLTGIRRAIRHAGLPDDALTILEGDGQPWREDEDAGRPTMRAVYKAFGNGWEPEGGIICASDIVAVKLLNVLAQRVDTPNHDFAVVGFDDHPASRLAGLTTVRPPLVSMGYEAARLLRGDMDGERSATQIRLPGHLIPRASASDVCSVRAEWRLEQANWSLLV